MRQQERVVELSALWYRRRWLALLAFMTFYALLSAHPACPATCTVRAIYPWYYPAACTLAHNFTSSWATTAMLKESDSVFQFSAIAPAGNYVFNIGARLVYPNGVVMDWAARQGGISSVIVEINGRRLDNSFLCITQGQYYNFSVTLDGAGTPSPGPEQHYAIDTRIPPEVAWRKGYSSGALPPQGFKTVVSWMEAIQTDSTNAVDSVLVDWLRLYAHVNGKDSLISADEYAGTWNMADGGHYIRHPWFPPGDVHSAMQAVTKNGLLVFHPSENPDSVWHWWNHRRAPLPAGIAYIFAEARIFIGKGATVQGGIDWYLDTTVNPIYNVTVKEAAVSDWYFCKGSGTWDTLRVYTDPTVAVLPAQRAPAIIRKGRSQASPTTVLVKSIGDARTIPRGTAYTLQGRCVHQNGARHQDLLPAGAFFYRKESEDSPAR